MGFIQLLVLLMLFALPCARSVDIVLFIRLILRLLGIPPAFLEATLSFFVGAFD